MAISMIGFILPTRKMKIGIGIDYEYVLDQFLSGGRFMFNSEF